MSEIYVNHRIPAVDASDHYPNVVLDNHGDVLPEHTCCLSVCGELFLNVAFQCCHL